MGLNIGNELRKDEGQWRSDVCGMLGRAICAHGWVVIADLLVRSVVILCMVPRSWVHWEDAAVAGGLGRRQDRR